MLRRLSSRKFDWPVYIRVCWAVYKNSLMASVSAGWWLDAPFRMRLGGLYSEEHGFKSALLHCCLRPVTALPWTRGCFPRTLNEVPYSFSSRWCHATKVTRVMRGILNGKAKLLTSCLEWCHFRLWIQLFSHSNNNNHRLLSMVTVFSFWRVYRQPVAKNLVWARDYFRDFS